MDSVEEEGEKVLKEESPNENCTPVPSDPDPSVTSAETRVSMLEEKIAKLNADFGTHRAKFKELYMQKEDELQKEKEAKGELEAKVKELQEELNETKSAVTVAEFMKENDIEMERQKFMHEIKSQRIKSDEGLHHLKSKYDAELQHLRQVNQKLEGDLSDVKFHLMSVGGSADVGPGAVFSAVTKSLARKLNTTLSTSNDSLHDTEDLSKVKPGNGKYAQEDAEMLRSLVVQLEEEVSALKEKLRNSDVQLATVQGAQASLVKGNSALNSLLEGEDVQGVLTQFDDKLREARCGLEAEKSSRADLEMYVAFANAQKTLLQDELDKFKCLLRELRQNFELEKKNHEELKETWTKANENFVSTQHEHLSVIDKYRSILTPHQLEAFNSGGENKVHRSSSPPLIPASSSDQYDSTCVDVKSPVKVCADCEKNVQHIEKLRGDLHKAAKLRNEMEEDWSRIYNESQSKLSSLEVQVGTYEVVLLELNTSCQQTIEQMDNRIKGLTFERESTQRTIEKLEAENGNLKGKHVAHSHQLQNESINMPNDVMALQEMVLRLKEELISVKIGKEQIEGELKFLKDQMQMIEEEKVSVEENLNSEISTIRERFLECKADNEKLQEYKEKLEKRLNDLKNRLLAADAEMGKLHLLKKQNQDLIIEKEHLQSELQELQSRVTTLRKELTNSEELQKDLVSLSKSLQMSLEVIRQAETDVRWQHPDDITLCNTCRKPFLETRDKHHCKHCGRIFCTVCTNQTVKQGNRDYNVCEVCHTLLAHDSPPYFSTEAPHSPD